MKARLSPMDIFGRLVGRLVSVEPSTPAGIGRVPERRTNEHLSAVATETSIVERAFDQIMADVDVPPALAARIRTRFVAAHQSGDPGRQIRVLAKAFDKLEWGEAYFDAWRMRFLAEGAFPHMWRERAKALINDAPSPPCGIRTAIEYLRPDDMRKLLDDLGVMPAREQRPISHDDIRNLLLGTGATGTIVKAALPRYELAVLEFPARRQRQKCAILAHTLAMRAHALRDRQVRSHLDKGLWFRPKQQPRPTRSDCPVETAYAARFMAGEIDGEPPFFPGDRTRLVI